MIPFGISDHFNLRLSLFVDQAKAAFVFFGYLGDYDVKKDKPSVFIFERNKQWKPIRLPGTYLRCDDVHFDRNTIIFRTYKDSKEFAYLGFDRRTLRQVFEIQGDTLIITR